MYGVTGNHTTIAIALVVIVQQMTFFSPNISSFTFNTPVENALRASYTVLMIPRNLPRCVDNK